MQVNIRQKGLEGFRGDAWLVSFPKKITIKDYSDKVKLKTKYFVVSRTNTMFTGWETLVFSADKNGKVIDWGEIAGGKGMTHEDAIRDLEEQYL